MAIDLADFQSAASSLNMGLTGKGRRQPCSDLGQCEPVTAVKPDRLGR